MIVRSALCLALAIGAFALLDDDDIDYSIGPPLHDLTPYATQLLAAAEHEKPATGPMASSTETRARYYMGSWYDDQVTIERPDFSTDAQMDAPFLFNRTASAKKDGPGAAAGTSSRLSTGQPLLSLSCFDFFIIWCF